MSLKQNQTDWQIKCHKVKKRTAHLYNSREWSDCTFQFDSAAKPIAGSSTSEIGTCISAHKLILSMASPVFATQFYGSMASDTILVTDIDRVIFTKMLWYIYTDEILLDSTETALDVYYAAKKYLLEHLQDLCIDFILCDLNPHTVCLVYEFACFHDVPDIKEKCLKIFRKKTLEVLRSRNFLKAKMETVKLILSMEQLAISNELDLFDALLQYADSEIINSSLVEKMADTLCTLFTKYSTKESNERGKADKTIIDSSTSDSESETDDRPTVSSVVLAKNTQQEKPQDKAELVRQLLRPCVQQIRFLTLAPRQFAESKRLAALLTSEEIMAVSMNIASRETSVAMPEGFSKSLVPRGQLYANSVATVHFTVNNILQIKKYTTEVFYALNIPWSVTVQLLEKRKNDSDQTQTYLRVSLDCLKEKEGTWAVPAAFSFHLQWIPDDKGGISYPCQQKEFSFSNTRSQVSLSYTWNKCNYPITCKVIVEPVQPARIPRPLSAYEIWRRAAVDRISAENPRYTEAQVSETVENASVVWWALLDKSEWKQKAAQDRKRYNDEKRKRRQEGRTI